MGLLPSWLSTWLWSTRANRLDKLNPPISPADTLRAPLPTYLTPQPPRSSRFDPSPDFKSNEDRARIVDLMVIHCTEGAFAGAVTFLTAKDDHLVSAHYAVSKAGDLVQMVGENDVAYHAGGTKEKPASWLGRENINGRSIGVELENKDDGVDPYTPVQLAVLLWLVLRTCRRFSLTAAQIVGHADVDPGRKNDPNGFPWGQFRAAVAFHLSRPGGIV